LPNLRALWEQTAPTFLGALLRGCHPPAAMPPAGTSLTCNARTPPPGRSATGTDTALQIGNRGDLPPAVWDIHGHTWSANSKATGCLPRCGSVQLRALETGVNMDKARLYTSTGEDATAPPPLHMTSAPSSSTTRLAGLLQWTPPRRADAWRPWRKRASSR
jgi:hypothetical protein